MGCDVIKDSREEKTGEIVQGPEGRCLPHPSGLPSQSKRLSKLNSFLPLKCSEELAFTALSLLCDPQSQCRESPGGLQAAALQTEHGAVCLSHAAPHEATLSTSFQTTPNGYLNISLGSAKPLYSSE